jgi:hypothetical protein
MITSKKERKQKRRQLIPVRNIIFMKPANKKSRLKGCTLKILYRLNEGIKRRPPECRPGDFVKNHD